MATLPEYVDGLPNVCGDEETVRLAGAAPDWIDENRTEFGQLRAACAIALHMHQPLIPAEGPDLRTARVISNLKHMMDNQTVGDNHNAPVFHWCYKRMGEFIPALIDEGCEPRVMLDYSGTLWHGLRDMGLDDVFDSLRPLACDPRYRRAVEWLGTAWGHAVAPSTPVGDYRRHVMAWRHHFAAIFGLDAVARVRGFSPSEMALPNHPDVAYEFVRTLRECGYDWVLVQEHTIEQPDGRFPEARHLPHRLVCRNTAGEEASIVAIVKTQGSDTKLVAQMQPFYEAQSQPRRWTLAGRDVPPLVAQIADGENGGVMMNEFPPKYLDVVRASRGADVVLMNVGEYLQHLSRLGLDPDRFPVAQPLWQSRIWSRMKPGDGPERLAKAMEEARREDGRFHMEGGSWTSDISWVRGYDNVLGPMEKVSALFHEKIVRGGVPSSDPRYRRALFHLMCAQTSCFRYWGQGVWTGYGRELCRRAEEVLHAI